MKANNQKVDKKLNHRVKDASDDLNNRKQKNYSLYLIIAIYRDYFTYRFHPCKVSFHYNFFFN